MGVGEDNGVYNFILVLGPTTPVDSMPCFICNFFTAFSVSAPKYPVTVPSGQTSGMVFKIPCNAETSDPDMPRFKVREKGLF